MHDFQQATEHGRNQRGSRRRRKIYPLETDEELMDELAPGGRFDAKIGKRCSVIDRDVDQRAGQTPEDGRVTFFPPLTHRKQMVDIVVGHSGCVGSA